MFLLYWNPQIKNNLCPFCRTPFTISRGINIPNNESNNISQFSNLSLDDNLLLDFADSFNDLHIRQRSTRRNKQSINEWFLMKKILLLLLLPIFSFGQVVNTFPWVNDFENYIELEQEFRILFSTQHIALV